MTNLLELSRIDRAIEIFAPPQRVWRALTDAAELSAWFRVTIEGEIAAGRSVWMTSVLPSHAGMRFEVQIVELTPHTRVVWRWHPGEIDASVDYSREPQTTVTFILTPTERGTSVEVHETGFDEISLARRAKVHADNAQGWTEVTVWLKDHVEAAR
jgi:uncharacterized protein YndB with AHSA1/START domain